MASSETIFGVASLLRSSVNGGTVVRQEGGKWRVRIRTSNICLGVLGPLRNPRQDGMGTEGPSDVPGSADEGHGRSRREGELGQGESSDV